MRDPPSYAQRRLRQLQEEEQGRLLGSAQGHAPSSGARLASDSGAVRVSPPREGLPAACATAPPGRRLDPLSGAAPTRDEGVAAFRAELREALASPSGAGRREAAPPLGQEARGVSGQAAARRAGSDEHGRGAEAGRPAADEGPARCAKGGDPPVAS
eukprot:14024642-Alexandrium_andersonii.AAC.1